MQKITLPHPQIDEKMSSWIWIGIVAGLMACFTYPAMVFIPLPRMPQVLLGATFGPALAAASLALAHILKAHRPSPALDLAAVSNALGAVLVTAEVMVQLAINYSTAPPVDEQLGIALRTRLWDVVLGLDVAFDVFIGLATLLFAMAMIRDPRFGRLIGWAGVLVALIMTLGANLVYFPDPPYTHGFPHVGLFTGLWYLAVVILIIIRGRSMQQVESGQLADPGETDPALTAR